MNVTFSDDAYDEMLKLPILIKVRLYGIVDRLEHWPDVSGAKPLRGDRSGSYRIRTGDYRVIFYVEKNRIVITKIGHRRDVYED